ncbi:MAG: glycosyltransferase family 2 protein [Methanosarcinales archaeon]|nr:MAG: glycosyltransferase family 2 protein [Methanosarcinales archaeon]
MPLTIIIPTKNEAVNIGDCLASVQWANEVFVVDSQSADETCHIAEQFGAKVIQFHYNGGWPKKKNWALQNLPIRNEWVFILDADERVTQELRDQIDQAVRDPKINGYYVRWKFIFLGRWMRHAWSHGWMLRLLRKGTGQYEDLGMRDEGGWDNEVHENIVVHGKTASLSAPLLHEANQDLSYWIKKQNEFSDWNAVRRFRQINEDLSSLKGLLSSDPLKRRKSLKGLFIRLPGKPLLLFFYLFVLKRGFLDGREGFYFCALRAMHELNISAKMFELALVRRKNTKSCFKN